MTRWGSGEMTRWGVRGDDEDELGKWGHDEVGREGR